MALVIGVDSSTRSTKAEVRNSDTGELVAAGCASHPATTPPVSEQHPDSWWTAFTDAIRQLGDARREVVAISIAAQQHGLVVLDESDNVLRPAKLWNDTTSAKEADRLVEQLGADWWADWAGIVPVPAITISKLAWLVEHEPDIVSKVDKLMLPHDWLTWKLTGSHVTDRGDASGTGWFDGISDAVLREPFHRLGLDSEQWAARVPRVLGPTEAAGELLPGVAVELGLSDSVVVGPGTGDNMGAALGLGLDEGDVVVSLGTSGTVYARTAKRAYDTTGAVAGFCDATGNFLPLVCTLNATKVTDTVAGWLGADAAGFSAAAIAAGVEPLEATMVPYFDGERTPNRPDARGVLAGIGTSTTREQIARAAHDGVICGLLDGLSALEETGAVLDGRLLLVGGGAKSAAYRQRVADISSRTVQVPENDESVAVGAAVQAAVVSGAEGFDSIASAWNLRRSSITEPRDGADGAGVRQRYAAAVSEAVR